MKLFKGLFGRSSKQAADEPVIHEQSASDRAAAREYWEGHAVADQKRRGVPSNRTR